MVCTLRAARLQTATYFHPPKVVLRALLVLRSGVGSRNIYERREGMMLDERIRQRKQGES